MIRAAFAFLALLSFACGGPTVQTPAAAQPEPEPSPAAADAPPTDPALPNDTDPLADFDERFLGDWQVRFPNNTTISYTVEIREGALSVSAIDDKDNEAFQVTDVKWENPVIKATFKMPSTNHVTHSTITLVSTDSLRDDYTGDETGSDIWTRPK